MMSYICQLIELVLPCAQERNVWPGQEIETTILRYEVLRLTIEPRTSICNLLASTSQKLRHCGYCRKRISVTHSTLDLLEMLLQLSLYLD